MISYLREMQRSNSVCGEEIKAERKRYSYIEYKKKMLSQTVSAFEMLRRKRIKKVTFDPDVEVVNVECFKEYNLKNSYNDDFYMNNSLLIKDSNLEDPFNKDCMGNCFIV